MDDNFRYHALPPEGLKMLRDYVEILDSMRTEVDLLQRQYQDLVDATHARAREELKPLWFQMAALAGIDAEGTWGNPEWTVERRFLEDNFGALIFIRQQHPLAAFAESENEEIEEGPPPGATLN